jgi:hypothetical protein
MFEPVLKSFLHTTGFRSPEFVLATTVTDLVTVIGGVDGA